MCTRVHHLLMNLRIHSIVFALILSVVSIEMANNLVYLAIQCIPASHYYLNWCSLKLLWQHFNLEKLIKIN